MWWNRKARRDALRQLQEEFEERRLIEASKEEFEERHLIEASKVDIAMLSVFINSCTLEGAKLAQGLDTSLRATFLANDNEGIREAAPELVKLQLAALEHIEWLDEEFAQELGEAAFEWGFEQWCRQVLDDPQPLLH